MGGMWRDAVFSWILGKHAVYVSKPMQFNAGDLLVILKLALENN